MRLSRALLVMLLLHVVAVGGILAFSLIKEHGRNHAVNNPTNNAVEAEDSDTPPPKLEGRDPARNTGDAGATLAGARPARADENLTRVTNDTAPSNPANDAAQRIAGGGTAPAASSANPPPASGHSPADSGKTYVVKKGDSPFTIADRLKVDAAALLKLNGIDDPKKLKPGLTLKIPAASRGKTK